MHKGIEIGRFSNFQFLNENRQNNSLWEVERHPHSRYFLVYYDFFILGGGKKHV